MAFLKKKIAKWPLLREEEQLGYVRRVVCLGGIDDAKVDPGQIWLSLAQCLT